MNEKRTNHYKTDTRLVLTGRNSHENGGFVNPQVVHASTVLFEDMATLRGEKKSRYKYGRRGTPTTDALTDAICDLENAVGAVLTPSGLNACTTAILSCVKSGDNIMMTDSVYEPTRDFCDGLLKDMGVTTTYYDPLIGAGIESLFSDNTTAVFTEAPGSQTFEIQDIPAIAAVAHKRNMTVLMDNTWATALYYDALGHGVDLSIQAGTKYLVGHADAMIGTIAANRKAWPNLIKTHGGLGLHVAPDDVYLALRGLRTMKIRLEQHQKNVMDVIGWLQKQDEVTRILYPALESDPGHAIWKRDFTGASGLFSFILSPTSELAIRALFDSFKLFGLGYCWGGYESLALQPDPSKCRTARPWTEEGHLVRLHIGLEDTSDLIADLENGFKALRAAS
ncbi:MAG: cystathionine beta-lyase [Hyphomicrobiales bacterium]|nr:MAG: cystathionine beta-lyase [Hyphomicrobiales bacterium]